MEPEENKYTPAEGCEFAEVVSSLPKNEKKNKKTPGIALAGGGALAGGATALGAEAAINLTDEPIIDPEPEQDLQEETVTARPANRPAAHTPEQTDNALHGSHDIAAAQEVMEVIMPDDTEIAGSDEDILSGVLEEEEEVLTPDDTTGEEMAYVETEEYVPAADINSPDFDGMPLIEPEITDMPLTADTGIIDDIDSDGMINDDSLLDGIDLA